MRLLKTLLCLSALLLASFAAYADVEPAVDEAAAVIATNTASDTLRQAQTPQVTIVNDVHRFMQPGQVNLIGHDTQPGDVDLILAGRLLPKVHGYLDLNLQSADSTADVEEAYATIHPLNAGIDISVGTELMPFGLINPLQPRKYPFADNPVVVANLLGDEFTGKGYELSLGDRQGLLQARLGQWTIRTNDDADARLGAGFTDTFTLARLTLKEWATVGEKGGVSGMKLGASYAYGPAEGTNLSLAGIDMYYKRNLGSGRNISFQTEAIRRRRDQARAGYQHEFGYYTMGIYQPAEKWEMGARYDWSEVPYLFRTHETALSLFGTRYLEEANYLRLQLKQGVNSEKAAYNEVILQMVFKY